MALRGALVALHFLGLFLLFRGLFRNSDDIDRLITFREQQMHSFSSKERLFGHEILAKLCPNRRCDLSRAYVRRQRSCTMKYLSVPVNRYLFVLFLLASNDIQLNPGPTQNKVKCLTCEKTIRTSQRHMSCDKCLRKVHLS